MKKAFIIICMFLQHESNGQNNLDTTNLFIEVTRRSTLYNSNLSDRVWLVSEYSGGIEHRWVEITGDTTKAIINLIDEINEREKYWVDKYSKFWNDMNDTYIKLKKLSK